MLRSVQFMYHLPNSADDLCWVSRHWMIWCCYIFTSREWTKLTLPLLRGYLWIVKNMCAILASLCPRHSNSIFILSFAWLQSCKDTMLLLLFHFHTDLVCVEQCQLRLVNKNHHFHGSPFWCDFLTQKCTNFDPLAGGTELTSPSKNTPLLALWASHSAYPHFSPWRRLWCMVSLNRS